LPDVLVIGGGGLRGLHGLGAVAQLKKSGRLAGVRHVVGTSSGAIVGYMFATDQLVRGLGLCLKAIPKRDIRIDKLASSYGIDSGRMLDEFLEELSAPVGAWTFEDMLRETGVDLHVVAVNLTKRELEFFCAERTPDVLVTTAVRYSSTVPGLFGVKRSPSGDIFVDGGILDNFPMERARAVTRNGSVVGISYKNAPSADIKNIRDFMIAVVETIATPSSTACPLPGAHELVLELETESISFDFGASAEDRLAWFREGADQARLFVKKIE
jgi:NTE family protein